MNAGAIRRDAGSGNLAARSVPPAARRSPGLVVAALVLLVILAPATAAFVGGRLTSQALAIGTSVLLAAVVAVGVNVTVGFAGMLNLGNSLFFAIGAYVAVHAATTWGLPGAATFLVAVAACVGVAGALGLLLLRASGLQFGLMTIGVALVTYTVLIAWTPVTGGASGTSTAGPIREGGLPAVLSLGPWEIVTPRDHFVAAVALAMLCLASMVLLRRTRLMVRWECARDDEFLAASVGIDVARVRAAAYVVGSVPAGAAGVLFAYWSVLVTPSSFGFAEGSIEPLAMVILGGAGTVLGPFVGAAVVVGLPELLRGFADYAVLGYGVLLLLTVRFAPGGIVGTVAEWWARVRATREGA